MNELGIAIPDFIEVQSTPLVRQLQYDVYGSGDISYSGSTDNCTGGFNVTDGTVRGLSTAGHCSSPPPPASTHRGQPIGTLMPQISLIEDGNGLDVSWYRNPSFNYPNIVRKSSTVIYTVVASFAAPPPKYQPTCVLPRASPEACDEVFDFIYWYKRGTTVASDGPYVVTKGHITAQKDSGSPWMYNDYARGIHAGGGRVGWSHKELLLTCVVVKPHQPTNNNHTIKHAFTAGTALLLCSGCQPTVADVAPARSASEMPST